MAEGASEPKPPAEGGLFERGPHWPLLLLLGLAVWAHSDLRLEVQELALQMEARLARVAESPRVDAEPWPEAPTVGSLWNCDGSYPGEETARVFAEHRPSIAACFGQHGDPTTAIELRLTLKVEPDGRIRAAHIAEGPRSALTECISNEALSWRYPRLAHGFCAEVGYPLRYAPSP